MHLQRALSHGYLPQEIPPSFSSAPFARIAASLTDQRQNHWCSPVRFSLARAGGVRRSTEIPNPLAQKALVQLCEDNWTELQRLTRRSPISLSRPVRARHVKSGRAVQPLHRLSEKPSVASAKMPGARATLLTDINHFYASIYTHAVDWAIRGKEAAKKDIRGKGLGASIDKCLRNSRAGQTVGISIGPDTSWLIAEVLLAPIDSRLCEEYPNVARRGLRIVDDMTFYSESLTEAHDVLATYQRYLSDYELSLNPAKVSVYDGLIPPHTPWVADLRQMRLRDDSDQKLANDVVDLFAKAFQLRRDNPTQGVLSYAIKSCDPFPAGEKSWPVYRDLVLAAVSQESSTLAHAYEILLFAMGRGLKLDQDRIAETLNLSCEYHARYDHGYEVSWILTILRDLSLPLDAGTARAVSEMSDNCSLVLLAEALFERSSLLGDVDMNSAVARAERSDALDSQDWLLAYELRHQGWCSPANWGESKAWEEMHSANVSFLVPSSATPHRRVLRRRRPRFMPSWGY